LQNFIERHARLVSDAHAWIHFGAVLFINNRKVGEGLTAGRDPATLVTESYQSPFALTGRLKKVVVQVKADPNQRRNKTMSAGL
jgi:hypothetical protein